MTGHRDERVTLGDPHDRLTALAGRMTALLDDEDDDLQAVVMLDDADRGGATTHGYENARDAMDAIVRHFGAMASLLCPRCDGGGVVYDGPPSRDPQVAGSPDECPTCGGSGWRADA